MLTCKSPRFVIDCLPVEFSSRTLNNLSVPVNQVIKEGGSQLSLCTPRPTTQVLHAPFRTDMTKDPPPTTFSPIHVTLTSCTYLTSFMMRAYGFAAAPSSESTHPLLIQYMHQWSSRYHNAIKDVLFSFRAEMRLVHI